MFPLPFNRLEHPQYDTINLSLGQFVRSSTWFVRERRSISRSPTRSFDESLVCFCLKTDQFPGFRNFRAAARSNFHLKTDVDLSRVPSHARIQGRPAPGDGAVGPRTSSHPRGESSRTESHLRLSPSPCPTPASSSSPTLLGRRVNDRRKRKGALTTRENRHFYKLTIYRWFKPSFLFK